MVDEKRHYYIDPLAAAWMIKHFSMKIFTLHSYNGKMVLQSPDRLGSIAYSEKKCCIHPDSLHMLEPRDSDVVIGWQNNPLVATTGYKLKPGYKIIQRDGKPFHWPECEE